MKRLALFVVVVAAVWVGFWFHHSTAGDPVDAVILLGIGVAYSMAAVVMLLSDRTWRTRALGMLGTFCGDAVLYSSAGVGTVRHVPSPEWIVDFARAFFVVGAPLLVVGIVRWAWSHQTRRGRP